MCVLQEDLCVALAQGGRLLESINEPLQRDPDYSMNQDELENLATVQRYAVCVCVCCWRVDLAGLSQLLNWVYSLTQNIGLPFVLAWGLVLKLVTFLQLPVCANVFCPEYSRGQKYFIDPPSVMCTVTAALYQIYKVPSLVRLDHNGSTLTTCRDYA